jgi:hypothetical protein
MSQHVTISPSEAADRLAIRELVELRHSYKFVKEISTAKVR